jgi:predicted RNA binding protein YcfA (HicA-like mRNA interferase family)
MPKLKVLSAKEILKIFESFGFEIEKQRGSHIKVCRPVKYEKQTLTFPNHKELDTGTIKAIYNQALKYISEQDLHNCFYTK